MQQNAAWENYLNRNKRTKKFLNEARVTSIEEIFNMVETVVKYPSPLSIIKFVKKCTTSGIWVSHAALRFILSILEFKNDKFLRLEHPLTQRILSDVRDNIPIKESFITDPQIFNAIFMERQFYHIHSEQKAILEHPQIKSTIVLVDGVLNEIFSTSTFERTLKSLHEKYNIKYFIPKMDGLKCTSENANALRVQIDEYIEHHPDEKLWIIGYSKGGIDSLHYAYENSHFASDHILGISTIACPILGSEKFEHKILQIIRGIQSLNDKKSYKKIKSKKNFLYKDLMHSLDQEVQGTWFKKNHKKLPSNLFYTALALESQWHESHFWMMLTKAIFKSDQKNDGVVNCESAQFPDYFKGINLGIVKGHHLIGTRSSFYSQEALIESLIIFLKYKRFIY